MKTASDYSAVRVRLPFRFREKHTEEIRKLRAHFPSIELETGNVARVIVTAMGPSGEVEEVYEWTMAHFKERGNVVKVLGC